MLEVPFKFVFTPDNYISNQVINFQFPIPNGAISDLSQLALTVNGISLPACFSICTQWPDKSIKWARCHFITPEYLEKDATLLISQTLTPESVEQEFQLSLIEYSHRIEINTGITKFTFNKSTLEINEIPLSAILIDSKHNSLPLIVDSIVLPKSNNSLSASIKTTGRFFSNDTALLEFDCLFIFNANSAVIEKKFTLRNPKPMVHHEGKWDLGNENSCLFHAFQFTQQYTASSVNLIINEQEPPLIPQGDFSLIQAGSGGENWQSDNHFDNTRRNNIPFNGYTFKQENDEPMTGQRCQPILTINNQTHVLEFAIDKFWQNFPKGIIKEQQAITLALFPKSDTLHELQPGEQKTHTLFLSIHSSPKLAQHLANRQNSIQLDANYIASTQAIPFFTAITETDQIDSIINLGIESDNTFFNKREVSDEYGWRNFGDLYADHETLEYKGDQELVSHYNNQYDPIYGFLKQYLHSHDARWLELATDLVSHVKDIDIYHTGADKAEYNHGLFWHTDHYLPAETATHRTYSKYQQANAYQDHAGGGGPGGQHCYSTGLMLHYLLTGDDTSKQAVIGLAEWITHVYEGADTVLSYLFALKNSQYRIDLKNPISEQYPLDRGTGNYIVALLDAFEVTGKQSYLDRASLIIKNTAKPDESLTLRQLDNVEECWFYTVFLQAVTRYLNTKQINQQIDESYFYARGVLINFAKWMVDNEQPYLNNPDILEYPNHTWTAQDIRKANVLYLAYYFDSEHDKATHYLTKADDIYQYVAAELAQEKTNSFTRILSLLMQNHGIKAFLHNNQPIKHPVDNAPTGDITAPKSTAKIILTTLVKKLLKTSIKNELQWLKSRSQKIDNLLSKVNL